MTAVVTSTPLSSLSAVVDKMSEAINALTQVLQAEHQQLSAETVNGSFLQRITEQKSSLLATLEYLEQQRQHYLAIAPDQQAIQRWQQLLEPLQRLSDMNQHNGWLLDGQRAHITQSLSLLQPHQGHDLYGADGYTTSNRSGKTFSI